MLLFLMFVCFMSAKVSDALSFRANSKYGNATLISSNDEFSGIDIYLYKDLPNLYLDIKVIHSDTHLTILDQKLNLCDIENLKGRFNAWISFLDEMLNFELKCPYKSGHLILKPSGKKPPANIIKEIAPAFMMKNIDVHFNDTWTFSTKIKAIYVPIFVLENNL